MKASAIVLQLRRVYSALKAGFALIGLVAVFCVMLLTGDDGELMASLRDLASDAVRGPATVASGSLAPAIAGAKLREQRALAQYIARRFRIADTAAAKYVSIAYRAGEANSVDPVLILAVMAVESRYNPVAESGMGAQGLMQVIPKFHLEKLSDRGGPPALLDPEVNIEVGTRILREYYRSLGDQERALQKYAGASDEPTSQYASKVFAERARLEPIRERARRASQSAAITRRTAQS